MQVKIATWKLVLRKEIKVMQTNKQNIIYSSAQDLFL